MLHYIIGSVPDYEVNVYYVALIVFNTLILVHFLCDFVFQTDFIARNKSPEVAGYSFSLYMLLVHSFIYAGLILVFTGYLELFFIMLVTHLIIDMLKIRGSISFRTYQYLHLAVILILSLMYMDNVCPEGVY